MKGTIFTRL